MSIPSTMQEDAFELDGAAEVRLFHLTLSDATQFHMSPKGEFTWQGDLYEEIPCHMTQVRRQADGEVGRPRFSFANPEGVFTAAVNDRYLENAVVTRHRILKPDLDADLPNALSETFVIKRVANVNREVIVCECRTPLDRANFKLPTRTFRPPEFPNVSF